MPGPYRTRADAIAASRKRTPRYRVPFPDLKVEERTSPCSNNISAFASSMCSAAAHPDAAAFPVGHNHKQGLELITPGMLPHLRYLSGAKT